MRTSELSVAVRKMPRQIVTAWLLRFTAGSSRKRAAISARCRISPRPALRSGDCSHAATSNTAQISQNQNIRGKRGSALRRTSIVRRNASTAPSNDSEIAMETGTAHSAKPSTKTSARHPYRASQSVSALGSILPCSSVAVDISRPSDAMQVRDQVVLFILRELLSERRHSASAGVDNTQHVFVIHLLAVLQLLAL